ncbi:DUF2815 family protein [Clostridium tyrobutyricum]|uniref:DUF2815 family protein n=1 Tax=Clostridium tyrobutyricum TaxID=1519 RepID=UPI003C2B4E37
MMSNLTKVITGIGRFSYANVWEPKSINGGDAKYSVSFIIPKSDKATIKKIKAAIEEAKKEGTSKLGGKIPANLKTPLRDGNTDKPDDEAYADSYFINANSNIKPGIVDKNVQPILDQSEFYSGCYGRASVLFYAYNANGNKGIACGLQNLQKLKDGEPLGGRSKAEEDFDSVEVEDDFLG